MVKNSGQGSDSVEITSDISISSENNALIHAAFLLQRIGDDHEIKISNSQTISDKELSSRLSQSLLECSQVFRHILGKKLGLLSLLNKRVLFKHDRNKGDKKLINLL